MDDLAVMRATMELVGPGCETKVIRGGLEVTTEGEISLDVMRRIRGYDTLSSFERVDGSSGN